VSADIASLRKVPYGTYYRPLNGPGFVSLVRCKSGRPDSTANFLLDDFTVAVLISWGKRYFLVASDLHHCRSFENVDEDMSIVTVDRIR
jgi:hypothetical protein